MKKLVSFLLSLCLISSLAVPASAAILIPRESLGITQSSSTPSYQLFTDNASENQLALPTDWTAEATDGEGLVVQFEAKNEKSSPLMQYNSIDLWSELSSINRKKYPRKDFDNDLFTANEIAELVGVSSGTWEMVTLGKKEYYFLESEHSTVTQGYEFTLPVHHWVLIENGWMYVYLYAGDVDNPIHETFTAVISTATYGVGSVNSDALKCGTYTQAVAAYEAGQYTTAKKLFESLGCYSRSMDYLRLIRIRSAGSNPNIGTGYRLDRHLTDSQKKDIEEAAKDVAFADTAQVLLCNTDVASYFLFGYWDTSSGEYAYLQFHKDGYGGYFYTRSENLSTAVSDTVSINDGYVRLSVTSSNKLTFHITMINADTMEIYSYEHCRSFTLHRN